MVNDNGFDLKDLVPLDANPASESPSRGMLPISPEKPAIEFDVLTVDNDKAMVNMLPVAIRKTILETFEKEEYAEVRALYLAGQESKLSQKISPSKVDIALRYNLWSQYYRALETGDRTITAARIYAGIATQTTFTKVIESNRLFWLLLPPTDYTVMNRRAHERGLDRLYQVLDKEPVDENGNVDYKLVQLQMKIFAMIDTRINGPLTHKHEITTKNVHLGISAADVQKLYNQTQKEVENMGKQDIVLDQADMQYVDVLEPAWKK